MTSFLQSNSWETFQQAAGFETLRIDGVLLIKKPLPFGRRYLYCPRADVDSAQAVTLAKREKAIFLRIDPIKPLKIKDWKLKIVKTVDVQPSQTVIVDLTATEEELLGRMHAKTRYNLRLAQKKGVTARAAGSDEFETFWQLMSETTERDGFRGHGKEYYQKMVETCAEGAGDMFVRTYFAEHEGKILAAGIFAFYNGTATYVHGASSNEYRNLMAPYALHWQVIRDAKALGCTRYDLYGIDENKWPGVTRFKRGFGGAEVRLPGTHDVVFNRPWYSMYQYLRAFRRLVS